MSTPTMRRCAVAACVAAGVALGAAGPGRAAPSFAGAAIKTQPAGHLIRVRWRGLLAHWRGFAPGILPDVPSGGDPYRVRPLIYPPPVVIVAPVLAPPILLAPLLDGVEPVYFAPIDFGPCFVPSEHTGQFGHVGSCAEAYFRQLINEPD